MLSNDGAATTGDAIFSAGAERIIEAGRILVFIGGGTAAASLTSSTADSLQQSASRLVPYSMSASERALSTFFDSSRHRRSTTNGAPRCHGWCVHALLSLVQETRRSILFKPTRRRHGQATTRTVRGATRRIASVHGRRGVVRDRGS